MDPAPTGRDRQAGREPRDIYAAGINGVGRDLAAGRQFVDSRHEVASHEFQISHQQIIVRHAS
jgi:hypothetical protein